MGLLDDAGFRRFVFGALLIFIVSGCFGAFWISDEFNDERLAAYATFGIPFAVLYFFSVGFYPDLRTRVPGIFFWSTLVLVVIFSWGNLLLLNALGEDKTTIVTQTVAEKPFNIALKRGGFGWLYKKRW